VKTRLQRAFKRIFIPASARSGHRRGEGFANGVEIIGPPIVCVLLGLWLDSALGTSPLFAIGLFLFGAAGSFASQYYQYQAKSRALDEGRPWSRTSADAPEHDDSNARPTR
jgi:F0F1-type ATP synthase assembly protein I